MASTAASPDVVIVGAGVAGASLAYHLARKGTRSVLVIEREPIAGMHSSGRNAAMFYALVAEPETAELAARSHGFLLEPPEEVANRPLLHQTGSLTLFGAHQSAEAAGKVDLARRIGLHARTLSAGEAVDLTPMLGHCDASAVVHSETDGTLDIEAMVQGLLRGACRRGARLRTGLEVRDLRVEGGRVVGLDTAEGPVECGLVVDASGAWAGRLGAPHGAVRPPLQPLRRHLLFVRGEPVQGPFVVDARLPFYVRPETGGFLLSRCDEDPFEPCLPAVDEVRIAEAMETLARVATPLAQAPLVRRWACLRTRTPDELLVFGRDPSLRGYFWMAGLGGHGMTAGVAAGELAAEVLLEERPEVSWASPQRHAG